MKLKSGEKGPKLRRKDTAFAASNALIGACLDRMQAREAAILADDDPEALHVYRVALRRARTVLGLLRGVYDRDQSSDLKGRFATLMDRTGAQRDLDVFLCDRGALSAVLPQALQDGLGAMFARLARERDLAHTRLAQHLESPAHAQDMAVLRHLFGQGQDLRPGPKAQCRAGDHARDLIARRVLKLRAQIAQFGADLPDAELHALRIGCKKLRYLLECFASLLPEKPLHGALGPLRDLQDRLGRFNDGAVQLRRLDTELNRSRDAGTERALGALIVALRLRQTDERARIAEALADFGRKPVRQAFDSLCRKAERHSA